MTEEYERVRGKIKDIIDNYAGYNAQDDPDQWMNDQLDEILPLVLIKHPDQSLPENPFPVWTPTPSQVEMAYGLAQQDMLNEGWVRVIK